MKATKWEASARRGVRIGIRSLKKSIAGAHRDATRAEKKWRHAIKCFRDGTDADIFQSGWWGGFACACSIDMHWLELIREGKLK